MTTQTISPKSRGWKGFTTLTWMTFYKHITNPFALGFSLILPILMYTMFGVGKDYSDVWLVGGNVAAQILTSMTLYAVIMVVSALATNVSLERISGVSRLFAVTPLNPSAQLGARILSGVAMSALLISVTFIYGYATGARMHPLVWAQVGLVILLSSLMAAALGLAGGFIARSDGAFALTSMVTVLSAFLSGMFIPLEQMGEFFAAIAPYSPFHGVLYLASAGLYGEVVELSWLFNVAFWTVFFSVIALVGIRRDTGR